MKNDTLESTLVSEELCKQWLEEFSDSCVILSLSHASYSVQQTEGYMLEIWCSLIIGREF